ncbi:MAG: transporter [Candidatus Binatia bacterium]
MTRILGWVVMAFCLAAGSTPAAASSLRDRLGSASQTVGLTGGTAFDALADVIADTAARALPAVSASAGFTYRFNRELEIFERSSETLGPVFLERPDTLGRSKFNVNVSFQYVQFDAFDGQDLGRLEAADPIVTRVVDGSGNLLGFTANRLRYDIGLRDYVTAFSFTYGILDDLDVNLMVPLIQTDLDVGVTSQQRFIAGVDGNFVPALQAPVRGSTDGGAFGVGDVLLRLKYQLPRADWLRWAAGLQMRMPSGNQAAFQGADTFEVSPALYASTVLWKRVSPYANVAVDLRADDVARSEARYGLGADVDVLPRLGLAFAFLGRSEFSESASRGDTSFLHLVNGVPTSRPLLGLDFGRKDFFDFSFGLRAVVWREVMLFLNGIYALNDEGLRNDTIIPTVGVEGTF